MAETPEIKLLRQNEKTFTLKVPFPKENNLNK